MDRKVQRHSFWVGRLVVVEARLAAETGACFQALIDGAGAKRRIAVAAGDIEDLQEQLRALHLNRSHDGPRLGLVTQYLGSCRKQ